MPYERTSELFEDVFGRAVSKASLQEAIKECYEELEETEEEVKKAIKQAEVAHFDETGIRVNGKRQWLHVASTNKLTHYGPHAKRGKEATEDIGILPYFKGKGVHDGWITYQQYEWEHALCNAHHLRELTFIEEQYQQPWAKDMKELLVEIKASVEQQKAQGSDKLEQNQIERLEQRYEQILGVGFAANPQDTATVTRGRKKQSKAKNLLDRLSLHRKEVLAFMYDFRVPFDNNLAERDLRMVKVQQKISGSFRSTEGASYFCRIRGFISTIRKQGQKVLASINHIFIGSSPTLDLKPG